MPKRENETRPWSMVGGDELMEVPTYTLMNGSEEDILLAKEMLRLTREIRILVGQYHIYHKITRTRDFGNACNLSPAREGMAILIGGLLRTIVVTTAAIFDPDPQTSNLKKLIKRATGRERSLFLMKFHANGGSAGEFERSKDRLIDYRRRINSGNLNQAIQRIMHVRKTTVAHFDANPTASPGNRRAVLHDVKYVVAAAMAIGGEANIMILRREVEYSELRRLLRNQSDGFSSTLMAGFEAIKSKPTPNKD